MHLVQKLPRMPSTTSGSPPLSSTTNTPNRMGLHNSAAGFRGWHSHHDPTVLFGAIGIPTELVHAGGMFIYYLNIYSTTSETRRLDV